MYGIFLILKKREYSKILELCNSKFFQVLQAKINMRRGRNFVSPADCDIGRGVMEDFEKRKWEWKLGIFPSIAGKGLADLEVIGKEAL